MTCAQGLLRLLWGGPEVGVLRDCQQLLPCSSYKHIVAAGDVTLLSQVRNLKAFLKEFKTSDYSLSILIAKIAKLIEEFFDMNDSNETHRRLCDFI